MAESSSGEERSAQISPPNSTTCRSEEPSEWGTPHSSVDPGEMSLPTVAADKPTTTVEVVTTEMDERQANGPSWRNSEHDGSGTESDYDNLNTEADANGSSSQAEIRRSGRHSDSNPETNGITTTDRLSTTSISTPAVANGKVGSIGPETQSKVISQVTYKLSFPLD